MRDAAIVLVSAVAVTAITPGASANVMVVNRDTGSITWLNSTGQVLDVAAYSLQSPSGGFRPAEWLSISGHYDADSGGALDPNDVWTVLGSTASDLSEATTGTTSIPEGALVALGASWTPGHVEDIAFEYLDVGLDEVLAGGVLFVSDVVGDYNGNGLVEQGDLDLVLSNWGRSATSVPPGWLHDFPQGIVDQGELDRVLLHWGVLGKTAPLPGGTPLTAAHIPEPSGIALSVASVLVGASLLTRRNRRPVQVQCSN